MEVFRAIKQRLEIAKSVSKAEARKLFTETKDDPVLKMTYYWVYLKGFMITAKTYHLINAI